MDSLLAASQSHTSQLAVKNRSENLSRPTHAFSHSDYSLASDLALAGTSDSVILGSRGPVLIPDSVWTRHQCMTFSLLTASRLVRFQIGNLALRSCLCSYDFTFEN